MASPLITGSWKKLLFINYLVDPEVLDPFVPAGTKLNYFGNRCYVTLAGFVFSGIRIKGIPVPFHQQVPEINLRFYVIPKEDASQRERGVVFLREIVSKPFMAWAANLFYREHYTLGTVSQKWNHKDIRYNWVQSKSNSIAVESKPFTFPLPEGGEEEFLTMQYFGYTKLTESKTARYAVTHPTWRLYPVKDFSIHVNFKSSFGKEFKFLKEEEPVSVYLAEGSNVTIFSPEVYR